MNKLILIRGVPGAGKSTKAKELMLGNELWTRHIEADQYFIRPDGVYDWNPKFIKNAHEWCQNQVEAAMKAKYMVIVANTFVAKSTMQPYLEIAKKYGYEVEILIMDGGYKSIHNVPDDTVARMRQQFEF
jgi:predicted kinase